MIVRQQKWYSVVQEVLHMNRDHVTHFVTHNNTSYLQAHSKPHTLIFMKFNRPCMIFH